MAFPHGGYAPPPAVRFDAISEAWSLFRQNTGIWIAAVLLVVVVNAIVGVAVQLPFQGMLREPGPAAMPGIVLTNLLAIVVSAVVNAVLYGGLVKMALNQLRTGTVSFEDLFSEIGNFGSLFLALLILQITIAVGLLIFVIPGLVIAGLTMLTIPIIVEQRIGPVDAIFKSIDVLKGQTLQATLFLLVLGVLSVVGLLLCCVGILFTFPLFYLGIAVVYRDFFGLGSPADPWSASSPYPRGPMPPPPGGGFSP